MSSAAEMAAVVKVRARERCEYCGMCQVLQGATFHIEHIFPRTCGGATDLENLALACPSCNLHKSDRSHGVDPETGHPAALFHPLRDVWEDHFVWNGIEVMGVTAVGRATIQTLDLNHPRRLRVRSAEAVFGLFPPPIES
jgi:hypothetical protein